MKQITNPRRLRVGDTLIITKYDNDTEGNWNYLLGERVEILDMYDECESSCCYHGLRVLTTKGLEYEIQVDDGHNGTLGKYSVIFRKVKI
jgi:hypothetical protein